MIENLADYVNNNHVLVRQGQFINFSILVGVGETDFIIRIEGGRVTGVRHRQLNIDSGRFAIRAPAEIWEEFWRPMPKREHHDLFSMMAAGLAQIDGDLLPLMQNLQYFKDLLGALRPAGIGN